MRLEIQLDEDSLALLAAIRQETFEFPNPESVKRVNKELAEKLIESGKIQIILPLEKVFDAEELREALVPALYGPELLFTQEDKRQFQEAGNILIELFKTNLFPFASSRITIDSLRAVRDLEERITTLSEEDQQLAKEMIQKLKLGLVTEEENLNAN